MKRKNTTIQKVAEAAGVSVTTVSQVLNNRKIRVRDETRERILKIAADLHYIPNALIRALQRKKSFTIGFEFNAGEFDFFHGSFIERVFYHIRLEAAELDYDLLLYKPMKGKAAFKPYQFMDGRSDGLIFWPIRYYEFTPDFEEVYLPIMVILHDNIPENLGMLDFDYKSGAKMILEHLLQCGHSRFVYATGAQEITRLYERRTAFLGVASEMEISEEQYFIWDSANSDNFTIRDIIKNLLRTGWLPGAVICNHDIFAKGFIEEGKNLGLRIPEDLAVVGYEGVISGVEHITRVVLDLKTLGRVAAQYMVRLIEGEPSHNCRTLLPVQFLIGATTGKFQQRKIK